MNRNSYGIVIENTYFTKSHKSNLLDEQNSSCLIEIRVFTPFTHIFLILTFILYLKVIIQFLKGKNVRC